jgi:hypothetical protein
MLWHDQLGHPRSIIMRRIIENSHGHPLKNLKIPLPKEKLGKDPIGSPPSKLDVKVSFHPAQVVTPNKDKIKGSYL